MVHPLLKAVPRNRQFWVADGRSLRNLEELALALQDMDETTFRRHVNVHKNDFHAWVRDVHQDKKLSGALLRIKKKEHASTAVQKRIRELLSEESYSLSDNFSSSSRKIHPTVWLVIIGAVLAVAFIGTISHTVITGAVVSDAAGRETTLIGVTLLVAGIFFIVAAVRKPKLIENLSQRKRTKKSKKRKRQ